MLQLLSKAQYEEAIAQTRDERMDWWRQARFGLFIHYGLYSQIGRNEWAMVMENYPISDYEKLADSFAPKPGAPYEWAALAKKAGMKYMVLTTRHHEGFSLWNSKANPYNACNLGPKRDIVQEFVDACRQYDLKIGFYSSLMDWHHPDGWRCAFDTAARQRFNQYIDALNTELLTQYGKIDILWYDVSAPMEGWEGWDSLSRNQKLRAIQPHIIINNRSKLAEDFGTPEGHITAETRDWEACMTFNDISWGYVDSAQARPYSYNGQRIVRMLHKCTEGGGNLLLNIGPAPDGSVPQEAVEPLETVGRWLNTYGDAVYGVRKNPNPKRNIVNGVCGLSYDKNRLFLWNWIWPTGGTMSLGGITAPVKQITYLDSGEPIPFTQTGHRVVLNQLKRQSPDSILGIGVLVVTFEEAIGLTFASYYPQLHGGTDLAAGVRPD